VDFSSTIAAIATPPGISATGMIRVSGPDAINLVAQIFKGKALEKQATHTLNFGRIIEPNGAVIDEVVVGLYKAPNSFTGENIAEINCHGSPYVMQRVMERLFEKGIRQAEAGEFTKRAFLNGKMDLAMAEAVGDLIHSESKAAHLSALNQLKGGISHEIAELREELIKLTSLLELELDFAEEDVEFADRSQMIELIDRINTKIDQLIGSFELGNVIKNGIPVAIVGRPNAGKSTLLNVLLEDDRAIVSEIAGTTRDTVEDEVTIEGVRFRFIDTAGIRDTEDTIEKIGVENHQDET